MSEQIGFEQRDAIEAPGGVGDFVDQLRLGGGGGLILIEELLYVAPVGFGVLRGQGGGAGSEAMAQRVERRTLLAWFGAGTGGVRGVGAVDGGAVSYPALDGIGACWSWLSLGCCCHLWTSVTGIARAGMEQTDRLR